MQVRKQQLELDMEQPDWLQIGKGVCQGCILSPCLFNLNAKYIMQNVGLDEAQVGIKIAWRIPWTEEPSGLQSMGCKESDITEQLSISPHIYICM